MQTSFYQENELKELGLKSFGENVLISRKVSIYGASNISMGDNVRIDDFCILSGNITIGSYVHISAYNALYGAGGIIIGNFSGISPRSTIYSASDDFSGDFMISPMPPAEFTNVIKGLVKIGNYVQIGSNSIIMPKVNIGDGVAIGAFTFVKSDLKEWNIYVGIPAKSIKKRSKKLLTYAKQIKVKNN